MMNFVCLTITMVQKLTINNLYGSFSQVQTHSYMSPTKIKIQNVTLKIKLSAMIQMKISSISICQTSK